MKRYMNSWCFIFIQICIKNGIKKNPEFKNNGTKEWTNICKQTKEQQTAKRATKKNQLRNKSVIELV